MFWNSTMECMSRADMEHFQSVKLREMVERIYHNVAFYVLKCRKCIYLPMTLKLFPTLKNFPLP